MEPSAALLNEPGPVVDQGGMLIRSERTPAGIMEPPEAGDVDVDPVEGRHRPARSW